MSKWTIVDFHTWNTLDRAHSRTMQEAELAFYKQAAQAAARDAEKMFDALKAGETVILGSSAFSGIRIIREPEETPEAPSQAAE